MKFNSQMLILARELAMKTQSELATLTGIHQSVISKYESGVHEPTEKHIGELADKLEVPVEFFFLSAPRFKFGSSCTYHRRQQSATVSQLNQILAEINLLRIHTSLLLEGVELNTDSSIPRLDIEEYDGEIDAIAQQVRRQMKVSGGPIRNLVEIIEGAGGIILSRHFGTRKLDAVSQWPIASAPPVFLVNADAPTDRQRWNLAHELGHLVMHRIPTSDMEREADRFAAEFLMPAAEIREELERLEAPRLHSLKLRWRTSMAAIVRRAKDLGTITESQYRHFNIKLSQAGYRIREPDILEPETPSLLETILDLYVKDLGYSSLDLCRLLRVTPKRLMKDYGIGTASFLELA